MRVILRKTEQGWIVIYDQILGDGIVKRNQNALSLHPNSGIPQDTMCDVLDNGYVEVEFEIVEELTDDITIYANLVPSPVAPEVDEDVEKHISFMKAAGISDHDIENWVKGYKHAKETLYTEEQVRAAMKYASEITNNKMKYMEDYIQSIKQSK